MTRREKLLRRFISRPTDFTYNELIGLMRSFGYEELQRSGSRVLFHNPELKHNIKLHKPHPGNLLRRYQIDLIIQELKTRNLI